MLFLTLLLAILALSSWAVFHLLLEPAASALPWIISVHQLLYALAFIALIVMVKERRATVRSEHKIYLYASTLFFAFLGIHSSLFTAFIFHSIATLAFRADLSHSALYSVIAAYVLMALGMMLALMGPKIVRIRLNREAKESLRILHITDLHISPTIGARYVRNVVKKTLHQKPDCIILTGDIGDDDPAEHEEAIAELAQLKAPHGVFVSLGNHELYHDTSGWIDAFRNGGMHVLIDEKKIISFNEKEIAIIGLSPRSNAKPIEQLLDRKSHSVIVLSHYPHRAEEAANASVDLFLAGHTHGGQFWPWSWLIHLFHRYAKGLYRIEQMHVYVSRGAGYWGPPLRLGARAEITLIELGI